MQRLLGPRIPMRDANQHCHGANKQSLHTEFTRQQMYQRRQPENDKYRASAGQRRYWYEE